MRRYDLIVGTHALGLHYTAATQYYVPPEGKPDSVMVLFAGMGPLDDIFFSRATLVRAGYTPIELWGWERTMNGVPAPIMGTVGLLTVEYMVIGVKGTPNLTGFGKNMALTRSRFSFDIPPPPATRPPALYEGLQSVFSAVDVASFGLLDVPYSWDRYGVK